MQQLLPDISSLYQRKYFALPTRSSNQPCPTNTHALLQRAQRFQETTAPRAHSRPHLVRIIREPPTPQTARRGLTASLGSPRPRQDASTPSLAGRQDLRQLLQVSQQELSELQSSMGGERTLMGLLKLFFEQRQERQQARRAQRAGSEFQPMQNLQTRRYQQRDARQFRIKKEQGGSSPQGGRTGKEEGKRREKELAPWAVHELDHL